MFSFEFFFGANLDVSLRNSLIFVHLYLIDIFTCNWTLYVSFFHEMEQKYQMLQKVYKDRRDDEYVTAWLTYVEITQKCCNLMKRWQ